MPKTIFCDIFHFSNKLENHFRWKFKYFWFILAFFLFLRLIWTFNFPMANDEVYYWDWSRYLQLSYVDAPPFVAWISYIGNLFFSGPIGVRLLLPFCHTITTIFLVLSAEKIALINNKKLTNENVLSILILTQLTPVFNLEGIILLPDSSLLVGISGALYFLLKAFYTSKIHQNDPLEKKYGLYFGAFLGIAALSKYHALPIALGFFTASLILRGKKKLLLDIPFWITTIIISIIISSPVIIWNYLNNFASIHFQSQHGFSGFTFQIRPLFQYIIGTIFYLLPWFFIPLMLFSIKDLNKKSYYKSIFVLSFFPFFILFFIILFSALGKQALPHWAMPGFLLLIAPFATHWQPLTGKYAKIWKKFILISLVISVIIPTLICIPVSSKILVNTLTNIRGNADPLFQVYIWKNLQKELEIQQNIKISSYPLSKNKSNELCKDNYELASLKWYWTSQIAFHFYNQPKVYNFDLNSSSFYSWRDKLYNLADCKFIVIGSKNHFDKNNIMKIMNIDKIQEFTLSPYYGEEIVLITGKMKDEKTLREIQLNLDKNIKF